ncbi:DUF6443 domain-containing protein [Pedobacter aquatilis]|uniref:DUF6443 domain-containing protein n=1 Tax=Pedobacter aquatilis TaxID=351343 RepID=UPI00292F20AB|nr:DUF6443 domain-containing protein [Pedobacter aquatilis]
MKRRLIYIFLCALIPGLGYAQQPTNSKNFVLESTVRSAGHKTGASLSGLPVDSVNRVIQYLDGLGRPLQSVNWQGSPAKKDVVQVFEYDAFGREVKKYNPYAEQQASDGSFKGSALSSQAAFYGASGWDPSVKQTGFPFSISVMEPSPLNRLLEQGSAGAAWQPVPGGTSGHTAKMEYGTNVAGEVKLWTVIAGGASSVPWPAGKLYKSTMKDENWVSGKAGITEEFKDFEGRVVLKKVWKTDLDSYSTYYVYDDLGNLRYVLPPAVNENGKYPLNSFSETDHVFTSFIYGYHYDGRKRLQQKKVPGKSWEWLMYNKLDQLVFSQDGNQRAQTPQLLTFNKYDASGRLVITGYIEAPGTSADTSVAQVDRGALQLGSQALDAETVLWETRDNGNTETGYNDLSMPQSAPFGNQLTRNFRTINYYDDYAFNGNIFGGPSPTQVGSSKTKGLLTGTKAAIEGTTYMLLTVYYYDEEGRVIQTRAELSVFGTDVTDNTYNFAGELTSSLRTYTANNQPTTIASRYTYDHQGRKVLSFSKIGSQDEVALSKLDYNELGQLKTKSLHSVNGSPFAQHSDFRYNERGWMKSATANEFSMELKYEDGLLPQFNGNISAQNWGMGLSLSNGFNYNYDKLSRLTKAVSSGISMSEELTYDEMGNISGLDRDNSGMKPYSYDGNRLLSVNGLTGNYEYDVNGNAVKDGRNGMSLTYNLLNLPVSANNGTDYINYVYDATGRKLAKYYNGVFRSYVDGIEGDVSGIQLIHTDEGVAQNNNGTYTYQYNLSDHLGNVRYSFDIYGGVVRRLQSDDYYAFGKRKSSGSPVSLNNKYLYNGKEVQDELGEQYDYGARFYDPVIGRFNTIDPMSEVSRRFSSYSYAVDNPIRFIDVDGMYADDPPWKKLLDFFGFTTQSPRTREEVIQKAEGQERLSRLDARNKKIEKNLETLDYIPGLGASMKMSKGMAEKDNTAVAAGLGMGLLDVAGGKVAGKVVETAGPVLREILQKEGGQVVAKLFNSVDGLLENVALSSTKKGATQGFIKGDGEAIFKALSKGGKQLESGAVELSNGTTLFNHYSTKTGQYTLDINKGGEIFKIRINP